VVLATVTLALGGLSWF